MDVIVVLIGAALLVAVGFLIAFIWAVRSGQYDDTVTPPMRVLLEEQFRDDPKPNENNVSLEK
ncbi:MAG: cbb3-type cytochrome oxidase assembly protein CcoS [bacterium]